MLHASMHNAIWIRGGRIIDPACQRDEIADIAVVDGQIAPTAPTNATVIDAAGWIIAPGLIDIHVHLREPGRTDKETIATGSAAAAAGGFAAVACMPNTNPTIDTPETVAQVLHLAAKADNCTVLPIAAITQDRAGQAVVDFAALQQAGAVAFSDDGDGVENDDLMRAALVASSQLGFTVIQHCEYRDISAGGVIHQGEVSANIGVPGLDPQSEEAMVKRDIDLLRETSGRYHVSHVSTAKAVAMIRQAKAEGLPITAEVTPHHLALTEQACATGDPNTKMHPPLRTQTDVAACRAGLADGTIDCVATDHAPHTIDEKAAGLIKAPPGIVGLETAIGLVAQAMINTGLADWPQLVAWLTTEPSRVLGLPTPTCTVGQQAQISVIDPDAAWTVDPQAFLTKGRNTPFGGRKLSARGIGTIRGRKLRGLTSAITHRIT